MKQNLLLATIFLLFLHNCMIWEEAHLPGYNSVSGKEAKEEIAQATWEAVSTGQLLWLAQNGMQAGVGPIGSISAINGFLASFLQPILSTIPDDEFYTQESLDQCTKDIRGQGALIYGTFLDSLPVARGITGFIRDGIFLPELASCDLNETGKIIIDNLVIQQYDNTTILQTTINHYLNLKIADKTVTCPYFNNRHNQIRGALAVLIGKGSPKDIEEEVQIISLKERMDLNNLPAEKIKEFLVENNLGVDCSGFVYHILDALTQDAKHKKLKQIIHFPLAKSVVRKMIAKLRPAENCGVTTLAHESNSKKIILDVSYSEFLDSTFLGVMVAFLKQLRRNDREMKVIVELSKMTTTTFILSGLDRVFTLEEDLNAAFYSFYNG